MEKLIYVHLARLGESEEGLITDSTNDWYLIKQSEGGDGVELTRVFEDVSPPNRQGPALMDTNCQVIGSCIYVIGGVRMESERPYFLEQGSNMIHFIDTRNPKDGWRTCCALPFTYSGGRSAVVDDQWLYIFDGDRHDDRPLDPWGYAVNVNDSKEVRKITPPGNLAAFPFFSTCLSPGTLVAYMVGGSTWYKLDCKSGTWTVYLDDSPYPPRWLLRCSTVVDDGFLYIYDYYETQLRSYDIRNKKELYVVDLPDCLWFDEQEFVQLIVLSKNRFCMIWDFCGGVKELCICYTRFSVSYHLPKPTVDLEEKQIFDVVGCSLLNVAVVDPHSDEANS